MKKWRVEFCLENTSFFLEFKGEYDEVWEAAKQVAKMLSARFRDINVEEME